MGQVVAVVSGKGGVGKTSLCAALAWALAGLGQKVLCIDADAGLRNLDLSLGFAQEPALDFTAVLRGEYGLDQAAAHPLRPELRFLTAPVSLQPEEIDGPAFWAMVREAREVFDWCLVDAPAGIGPGFRLAVAEADQAFIVATSDPASLRDAARTADELERCSQAGAKLVVNRVRRRFLRRTGTTVDDAMDTVGLPLLGLVPEDEAVPLSAARDQLPGPKTPSAQACGRMARRLLGEYVPLPRRRGAFVC